MIQQNYDLDRVKHAAKGHWKQILSKLGNVPDDHLDGRGYPCPVCRAGTDRFNAAKDVDDTGSCFCRQCNLGGDGFHLLQKVNEWDLNTTVNNIGYFLSLDTPAIGQPPIRKNGAAKSQPGMLYPVAVRVLLASIRSKLPVDASIPDEPITYHYQEADGSVAGVVLRWDRSDGQKEIRPLSTTSDGWSSRAIPVPRPLYRLPKVVQAETVFVCEGEKAVETVESFGLVATTSSGGSSAASKTDWSPLDGKRVIICRDFDSPGAKYRDSVAGLISTQAPSAVIHAAEISEVWPELPAGGDAADWSEQFDSKPPEWFCEQLESITRPLEADPVNRPVASDDAVGKESWPDLIAFDDPELLRLDSDILPDGIREMVKQVSYSTETPPEMALTVALGALATATMRKWDIEVEADFRQPLNLYLCCVMPPGNRKSAVFRRMFAPIHERENEIRQAAESEFMRSSSDHEIWEKQCADLKTRISKAVGDDATDMRRELDNLLGNAPEVIHKPQLVSDDVTPESVCSLLGQNRERLGIASAEPEIFDLILGRYSKGPNLGLWLKGHDGDRHTENRRNRPDPIVLNAPLLSMTVMAQPEAVQAAGGHRVMRGRGMLDRFLFACPPSPVGLRECVTRAVDLQVQQHYANRLSVLLSIDIVQDGFGYPEPRLLTLSQEAHSLWKTEQLRLERRMATSEPLSMIAGWGSKFAAQVARIAANLHLLEYGERQTVIDPAAMEQAIHIGRFIESHTRAVFQAMGQDPAIRTAQKVARHVVKDAVSELSRRDVMRIDRTIDVTDAQAAIELLVDHGYLIPLQGEKRRGRPSDRYAMNPAVFSM